MSDPVAAKLAQLVAPGAEVIITAGEPASLLGTALGDRLLVPLRAIAHIRKSGLVIENLEAYLTRPAPVPESTETSLRSEGRLVGTECVSRVKPWCAPFHQKKKHKKH